MEDLDLALSGLEKIHKVVNDVSPLFCNNDVDDRSWRWFADDLCWWQFWDFGDRFFMGEKKSPTSGNCHHFKVTNITEALFISCLAVRSFKSFLAVKSFLVKGPDPCLIYLLRIIYFVLFSTVKFRRNRNQWLLNQKDFLDRYSKAIHITGLNFYNFH